MCEKWVTVFKVKVTVTEFTFIQWNHDYFYYMFWTNDFWVTSIKSISWSVLWKGCFAVFKAKVTRFWTSVNVCPDNISDRSDLYGDASSSAIVSFRSIILLWPRSKPQSFLLNLHQYWIHWHHQNVFVCCCYFFIFLFFYYYYYYYYFFGGGGGEIWHLVTCFLLLFYLFYFLFLHPVNQDGYNTAQKNFVFFWVAWIPWAARPKRFDPQRPKRPSATAGPRQAKQSVYLAACSVNSCAEQSQKLSPDNQLLKPEAKDRPAAK